MDDGFRGLKLYNTLTRQKEPFRPLDWRDASIPDPERRVRMYVCGPTVYDFAHIGNARPVIVFDVLFRLLRHLYGPQQVVYARNITDVDDKINARAREEGVSIRELTERTARQFHEDVAALGCLPPTVEPRATEYVDEMKAMIERLVEKGHAYVAEDHVLFHVPSMPDYGRLSGRSLDEMQAGARVDVAPYKRDPMDFVLWKPSKAGEPAWPSPCGIEVPGRPGWHIECSAMAERHLGDVFDIHGGGIDLVFPHHENEIAQSRCAHGTPALAQVWMHNGFLQVEGAKMSKSLDNFVTIRDLLKDWPGEVIRLAMLMTHYRQPLDFTEARLLEAKKILVRWAECRKKTSDINWIDVENRRVEPRPSNPFLMSLLDDLNTPGALNELHRLAKQAEGGDEESAFELISGWTLLGLYLDEFIAKEDLTRVLASLPEGREIDLLIAARAEARKRKDWAEADRIRDELVAQGIAVKDGPEGTTWEVMR